MRFKFWRKGHQQPSIIEETVENGMKKWRIRGRHWSEIGQLHGGTILPDRSEAEMVKTAKRVGQYGQA